MDHIGILSWLINRMNSSTTTTTVTTTLETITVDDLHSHRFPDDIPPVSESEEGEYNLLFEFIVVGIGITIVTILGIIGNIVSGCVLSRHSMRSSISCLLLGLTLSDTVLIISSLLIFGLPVIFTFQDLVESNGFMEYFYPTWGPSIYAIAITGQTSSVYFTIAVTIERYLVVCWPLQSRSICTWKRTKVCSLCVFLFAVVYNLPRWWELHGVSIPMNKTNATSGTPSDKVILSYQLHFTQFRLNPFYIQYYINWAYLVIMCLFPFVILVTLNVLIYCTIRRSNKSRHGIISGPTRDYSYALVLFCVVITFLICNTLALVVNLMESMWQHYIIDMENLSNFLITFNSSVNCAIYCAFGNKFREQLFQMRDELGTSFHGLISNVSRKFPMTLRIKLPS